MREYGYFVPWRVRFYRGIRSRLLHLRAVILYGKESLPYAKELANFARFYQWLIAEIGDEPMKLLVAKFAARTASKTIPPNPSDYLAIVSVIAHPDRINARFPLYDPHAEADPRLGAIAGRMAALAHEYSESNERGVWAFPKGQKFDLDAAAVALRSLRDSHKEDTE